MTNLREMHRYLQNLIEHQEGCTLQQCSQCALLDELLRDLERRLFSSASFHPNLCLANHDIPRSLPAQSSPPLV